jgi:hypothetical protein
MPQRQVIAADRSDAQSALLAAVRATLRQRKAP